MNLKKLSLIFLALLFVFTLSCGAIPSESADIPRNSTISSSDLEQLFPGDISDNHLEDALQVEYGCLYYDLEHVVLYLSTYGELPDNYITKNDARSLGWEGGSVEAYLEGAAIGGDTFGNREELLPSDSGRIYTECDIDTLGASSRGAKRLVFSNDGLYFYTSDHYESFTEIFVIDGKVVTET